MAIGASPIQTAVGQGAKTATFGSNTVAGNAIIVLVGTDQEDVTNVTDDNGNTYTEIVKNTTGARSCAIWFAVNITGGKTTAVTLTTADGPGDSHIIIAEWNTSADNFEVDQFNTADSSAQTNHPKGSITTVHNDTLVVGIWRGAASGVAEVTARESGYSALNGTSRTDAQYQVYSSTVTTDGDITTADAEDGGNAIASLNEIAGGGGGLVIPVAMNYYRCLRVGA